MPTVDAQQWLNEQFPTKESKEAVKELLLNKYSGNSFDNGIYKSTCSLKGELDLTGFVNLNKLDLSNQILLCRLKGLENLSQLVEICILNCVCLSPVFTFLNSWKQEINQLKTQLDQEKQALIQLAQKKIKNQKEARELLSQLQTKWTKEKEELIENLTKRWNEHLHQEKTLLHKEIQLIKEALYD